MFYYKTDTPNQSEYVYCVVVKIDQYGIECQLPGYDNASAYLSIKDLQTEKSKRIRVLTDVYKYLKVDQKEVFEIKEIDNSSGKTDIYLTKKYLEKEKIQDTITEFKYRQKLFDAVKYNNAQLDNFSLINEIRNAENLNELNSLSSPFFQKYNLKNRKDKVVQVQRLKFQLSFDNMSTISEFINDLNLEETIECLNLKAGEFFIVSKDYQTEQYLKEIIDRLQGGFQLQNQTQEQQKQEQKQEQEQEEQQDQQPKVNISCVGHPSHGKTTIIHKLTGIDTKKYKKEMEMNKTLKLGYTNTWITKCVCVNRYVNTKCENKECDSHYISIVDVPGHQFLMNTMLCGASISDCSIFVVAGNEPCPQSQTENHLMAITINNKKNDNQTPGLIVQNKLDLVSEQQAIVNKQQIEQFVQSTIIENAPIIPASAQMNLNTQYIMEWVYKYTKQAIKHTNESEFLKAVIVRTFDINKPGTLLQHAQGLVLGCSILSGTLTVNDPVFIMPQMISTRVLEIKTDKYNLKKAQRGGLIAVKTDLNPYNCDQYIGSFIIKKSDFKQEYLLEKDQEIKLRMHIMGENYKFITKGQMIDINVWGKYIKDVEIVKIKKKQIVLKIQESIYIDPRVINEIIFIKNNFVLGYGIFKEDLEHEEEQPQIDIKLEKSYDEMYEELNKEKQELEERRMQNKIKLPVPQIVYENTFTKYINFEQTADLIKADYRKFGEYIRKERGLKSMSVTEKALKLKGRITEQEIQKIILDYIKEHCCDCGITRGKCNC